MDSHSLYGRPGHHNVLVVRLHIQLRLSVIHQLQIINYNQCAYEHTILRFNGLNRHNLINRPSFQTKCCKNQPLGPSIFLNCRNSCSSFLKGEYLKMSSVSVAYFSVSWVRGCWVFTSQLGNGTITYENRPKAFRDLLFAQTERLYMMLHHQLLTSSRPSSSWNVRDKNKHVNLSSFLVKRMKSFPIRMEPLKETRTFMYKNINNEIMAVRQFPRKV